MNPTLVLLAALTAPPPTVPPVCNRTYAHLSASAAVLAVAASAKPPLVADAASVCDCCAEWNADREPFHVFGNTYYVGVAGLSSVLITSNDGHVLIDGALPQSAPLIDAHIRAPPLRRVREARKRWSVVVRCRMIRRRVSGP